MAHNHTTDVTKSNRFIFSLVLTGLIFFAEFFGGYWTGSLALLSDSAHVFMDVFALGLSYLALRAAELPPNEKHTYGYHRLQVLAALVNGILLFLIAFGILHAAWQRFQSPQMVIVGPMLIIAIVGLVINLIVAFALHVHEHDDLNTRSAYLHVLGDALASIGVIGSGVILLFVDWPWLDPLVSVLIGMLIMISSGRLLKESVHILAEGMPDGMTTSGILQAMQDVLGIDDVHDLHVWTISPGYIALSAHVVLTDQSLSHSQIIMDQIKQILMQSFNIEHSTIQFECENCGQGMVICLEGG